MTDENILRRAAKAAIAGFGCFAILTSEWAIAEVPPPVEWIRQMGTFETDVGRGVTVDVAGNAYVSGFTGGSLAGPKLGRGDAFLAKFDSTGTQVWLHQFGTADYENVDGLALDPLGNIHISGETLGGLRANAFLAKCDPSGTLLWFHEIGSAGGEGARVDVAGDVAGNAYVGRSVVKRPAYPLTANLDVVLGKYDAGGTLLWSREIGTVANEYNAGVAVDGLGNAYFSGRTSGSLSGTNAGDYDAFVAKIDPSGTLLWTRQVGTAARDESTAVAVDGEGNAYVSGHTDGSLGGPSAGGRDGFLAKYDVAGTLRWTRQIGTTGIDEIHGVAVDDAGNAYVSGFTQGSLDGANAGFGDIFLAKYDPEGTLRWLRQMGTSARDDSFDIAVDGTGNGWITGETYGGLGGPQSGNGDVFLIKFGVPEPGVGVLVVWGVLGMAVRRRKAVWAGA